VRSTSLRSRGRRFESWHRVTLSLRQILGPHINPLKASGLYGTGFNIKKRCSLPVQCIRMLYRVFEQTATVFIYSVVLLGFIAETEGVTVRYEQNL